MLTTEGHSTAITIMSDHHLADGITNATPAVILLASSGWSAISNLSLGKPDFSKADLKAGCMGAAILLLSS